MPGPASGPAPHLGAHSPFPIPADSRVAHGVAGMIAAKRRELLSVFRHSPSDQNTLNDMAASSVLQSLAAPLRPSLAGSFTPRRCYWLICELSDDGQRAPCLFLDPSLTQHFGSEASLVVGSSIIDWIHPQEASLCRRDLEEIVASKRMSGSITRCRMNRITAIRRALGNQHPPVPTVAPAIDQNWSTVHLISNWIGGRRLLVFVHNCMRAPLDLQSEETDPAWWTHRCGMDASLLSPYELDVLWRACMLSEPPCSLPPARVPECIFQIIGFGTGEILFSWPPPRLYASQAEADKHKPDTFHVYADGSYFADDFARLVAGVPLPPRGAPAQEQQDDDQPETSCTRRFHATHTFVSAGVSHAVESVVVPYGQIIFACLRMVSETPAVSATPEIVPPVTPALTVGPGQNGAAGTEMASPWGLSPGAMKPSLMEGGRGGGMSPSPTEAWPSVITSRPSPQPAAPPGLPPISGSGEWDATLPTDERRRKRCAGSMSGEDGVDGRAARRRPSRLSSSGDGVEKVCSSCGTRSSPEWRKGPGGRKSLCNACGLRFSRQIQRQQKLLEAAYAQGGEEALNRAAAALSQAEGVAEAAAAVLKRAAKKRVADATRPTPRPLNPSVASNPPPAPLGPGPGLGSGLGSGLGPGQGPGPTAPAPTGPVTGTGSGSGVDAASPSPTVFSHRGVSNASSETVHAPSSHASHSAPPPPPPPPPHHQSHPGGGYAYEREYRPGGHTPRLSLSTAGGYGEYPKYDVAPAPPSGVSYDYPVLNAPGPGAGGEVYDTYYRSSSENYYRRPPRGGGGSSHTPPAPTHGGSNGTGWMPLLRSPHLPTSY